MLNLNQARSGCAWSRFAIHWVTQGITIEVENHHHMLSNQSQGPRNYDVLLLQISGWRDDWRMWCSVFVTYSLYSLVVFPQEACNYLSNEYIFLQVFFSIICTQNWNIKPIWMPEQGQHIIVQRDQQRYTYWALSRTHSRDVHICKLRDDK